MYMMYIQYTPIRYRNTYPTLILESCIDISESFILSNGNDMAAQISQVRRDQWENARR